MALARTPPRNPGSKTLFVDGNFVWHHVAFFKLRLLKLPQEHRFYSFWRILASFLSVLNTQLKIRPHPTCTVLALRWGPKKVGFGLTMRGVWTIYQLFLQSSFPLCACAFFVFVGRVVEGGGVWADPVLFEQVGCGLSPEHIQIEKHARM